MASASRIAQALRDIAAALENLQDSEWEKVSEPEHSSETSVVPPTPLASPVAREACGSDVTYHEDIRCYVIVQNPTGWIGFISGPAKTTWPGIEKCLPGGRLAGSGVRLRRVKDRVEAQGIWETVHKGKPMPELSLQTAPRATSSKQ